MFYCDQEIPWGSLAAEGGVKLATSNRCHLFCDMVTTVATPPFAIKCQVYRLSPEEELRIFCWALQTNTMQCHQLILNRD